MKVELNVIFEMLDAYENGEHKNIDSDFYSGSQYAIDTFRDGLVNIRQQLEDEKMEGKLLTFEMAKELCPGDLIYHKINRNADGTSQRWAINGMVKTWARDKTRIRIPIKHGLYSFGYLTQDNLNMFTIE